MYQFLELITILFLPSIVQLKISSLARPKPPAQRDLSCPANDQHRSNMCCLLSKGEGKALWNVQSSLLTLVYHEGLLRPWHLLPFHC